MSPAAPSPKPAKDFWDKLDVFGKLASGIVLVIIAMLVQRGADRIATSLQTGQLVQSLIRDLAAPDTAVRQEIALAALVHAVGRDDSSLVWDICERILRNSRYQELNRTFAYQIMYSKDSARAKNILAEIANPSPSTPGTASAVRIQDPVASALVSRYLKAIVFIQFNGEENRAAMTQLRARLQQAGLNAPGVEEVNGNYGSSIRFFHAGDRQLADSVQRITRRFFEERRSPLEPTVLDQSTARFKVPPGQVEVWVNLERTRD